MSVYSELETRYDPLVATTMALKKALVDDEDRPTVDGIEVDATSGDVTTTSGKIPIYTARDEKEYVQYKTPSVVIFQPHPVPMRDMVTNLKKYRDFDFENGTVQEFEEPVPHRLRFQIHLATRNPDNDAQLLSWFMRLMFELTGINVKISPDIEEYDRVTLFWHDPEEMESDDISKIREFRVDARTRHEAIKCHKRNIVNMATALVVSQGEYTSSSRMLTHSSFNVTETSTEIKVSDSLEGWPMSGSARFEDGDVFTYSSRSNDEFKQVGEIDGFHHFDSEIRLVDG